MDLKQLKRNRAITCAREWFGNTEYKLNNQIAELKSYRGKFEDALTDLNSVDDSLADPSKVLEWTVQCFQQQHLKYDEAIRAALLLAEIEKEST